MTKPTGQSLRKVTKIQKAKDNSATYKLHVVWAMQELAVINKAIYDLNSFSRVNPTLVAHKLTEERKHLVTTQPAYQEAAWRMLAGVPVSTEVITDD